MTAINSLTSFKGDQEQRSGGILFPAVGGAVVGGIAGLGIRKPYKPNLEGVSADTFEKTMAGVADLTDDQKAAVKTIKEHLAGKSSEEKTDAKAEKADAKDAEAGAKESKTSKAKSVATNRELEDIFRGSEELPYDKYLQKKYGATSVGSLMDRRQKLVQEKSSEKGAGVKARKEGNIARYEAENIEKGIKKAQSIVSQKQQIELAELNVREAQINLDFAEKADKEVAQSELNSAKKALNKKKERLATITEEFEKMAVDSQGKTRPGFSEVKAALEGEITTTLPSGQKVENAKLANAIDKRLKNAGLLPSGKYDPSKELGQLKKAEEARIIEEFKIGKDAVEKAKKQIRSGNKPKNITEAEFIKQAKDKALEPHRDMINKRVKLAVDKRIQEIKAKETEAFLNRFHNITSDVSKMGQIEAGKKLSGIDAKIAEMDADIELTRNAKKNNTKITKAQAEETMQKATDKLKETMGKVKDSAKTVAKDAGEKAGKAGSESKGVTAGIEDALKALKDKLPTEFKKFNSRALIWGAGIGLAAGVVLKWMFGGKSEE